ncbi:acetyl-CoA carboxylase carboxyltransferase subunit alpha [Pirellulales bacterium]|jgi:acetyl-CoA carboxylase carboxyl transferase subunit alpha|nr:acetyl-CoA carboxylase carboxyltransferase subunit alpha [Pirellulales bacterium]MDB4475891.1 acetyl-CoA carboxylase carboxyltransferase subunit alpha [Pirellulales bacterium]MDC1301697.1 acetyl-CoA carboxylase carboxyltransferase subunit alpha [bacterium]
MARGLHRLPLEKPIYELEDKIADLETAPLGKQSQDEVQQLRRECADLQKQIFSNLDPWQTVEVARHPNRPKTSDYLDLVFDEFVELHGDKAFGDDPAMLTGFAKIDRHKVLVIGHQKGKTLTEKQACHFGCAHPEGYRKAMGKMRLAAKYGLPVICLIDTPGAYPGIGAEERGQAQVIAESMFLMASLKVPIICVVIGEGGSGGALGIGVGDRVAILEHAYYSVISPEGCAGILWKSAEFKADAARALRMRAWDLKEFGVIDKVIDEPRGGAHRDPRLMAARLKTFLERTLRELVKKPVEELVESRYEKFRQMGTFLEA